MARIMKHGKCGDKLTWTINNEGLLTISGDGEMWDYDHPDENDNYWESWDEESWDKWQNLLVRNSHSPFENKNKIKFIKILYGTKSISDCAFCYCLNLTSVEIPNSVTEIKGSAFYYCRSLESIKIPNSVTSIGKYAFYYCDELRNVKIPNSVTRIGCCAFKGCYALTNIEIPNSVTKIEHDVFDECSVLTDINVAENNADYASIDGVLYDKEKKTLIQCPGGKTNIEIPDSVTNIGKWAFSECEALTSIHIRCKHPENLEIHENTFHYTNFENCTLHVPAGTKDAYSHHPVFSKFKKVIMTEIIKQGKCGDNIIWTLDNEGLLTISGEGEMWELSTFSNNKSIKKAKILHGVTNIGELAFSECEALTSIEIPDSVTEIGEWAFDGCKALTSIEIPDSVTEIGESAFDGCEALTSIEIPNSVTSIGEYAFDGCEALTNIEIPNSVTKIGEYAFAWCKALTSITIPNSVTSIGSSAFEGCKALTSIDVAEGNANYASIDGVLYDKHKKLLMYCSKSEASIEIPNSITKIEDFAFEECKALTSIEIPNSVTSIGNSAFYGCEALTNIEIPNSVTKIEEGAFAWCNSLTNIEIAEDNANYVSIDGVLYDKEKKTLIQCPGRKENIKIPDCVTHIGKWAFSGCKALANIEIPNSVTRIGNNAFSGCKALTNIEIPNSVTKIGEYAFAWCKALTSIEIPNSVTEIGKYAFYGCEALTNINVAEDNDNYISIDGVLYDKEKKTLIQCPGGKTNIEIPNSVTSIGDYAFEGCTALTSIHIRCEHPEELKIDEKAFYNSNIENCTLHVPIGTGYAYRHHPVFSYFKEVVIEK